MLIYRLVHYVFEIGGSGFDLTYRKIGDTLEKGVNVNVQIPLPTKPFIPSALMNW
jgi:hypothetical protein